MFVSSAHLCLTWQRDLHGVLTGYTDMFTNGKLLLMDRVLPFCVSRCADIVFLRSWYPVAVPQLYNPVTSLLLPVGQKDSWLGMRTLGQLKHDLGVRNKPNTDSLYKVGCIQSAASCRCVCEVIFLI